MILEVWDQDDAALQKLVQGFKKVRGIKVGSLLEKDGSQYVLLEDFDGNPCFEPLALKDIVALSQYVTPTSKFRLYGMAIWGTTFITVAIFILKAALWDNSTWAPSAFVALLPSLLGFILWANVSREYKGHSKLRIDMQRDDRVTRVEYEYASVDDHAEMLIELQALKDQSGE